jgi:hypothetical protein
MHLVPLWSGIMIPSNLNKTRLVNNFVENHFGQTKHNLIPRLKISISEFVGLSYKKLIFFSYLFFDSNFEDSNLEQKNISNDLNFEKWKDKNEKIRREKGIYYENKDILKFKTLNNYDFINSLEKNDFETFDVMDGIEENNQDKKIDSKIDFLKKYLKLNGNEYQIEAYLEFEFMISIQNQKYDNIKSIFLNHQILFENLLSQIRSKKISLKFVNQKTADLFITKLSLPNGMFPILVDGDGNCLYNSISMICFNTQRHFRIIKALSMYVMIKNREKFEHYMKAAKYDFNFETFLERTSLEGEYGTELNIISIALMLNKNIACYNASLKKNMPNRIMFKIKNCANIVILGLADVHYFPILLLNDFFIDQLLIKETVLDLINIFKI